MSDDMFEEHTSNPEIVKGDFIRVKSSGWVGKVLDNMKRSKTRLVDVWGMAHEAGSVYADDIEKISGDEFEKGRFNTYVEIISMTGQEPQWSDGELAIMRAEKKLREEVV